MRSRIAAPPPTPHPRRPEAERIVQAVIQAAMDLGPQAPLAEIAARAGVGAASLHRYFPSAAAIYAEVARQTYHVLLRQVHELTARTDLDVPAMVELVCRAAVAGPGTSWEHRRMVNLEVPLAWSVAIVEPVYAAIVAELARWLRAHDPSPPTDLEHRMFVALGMVRGVLLTSFVAPSIAPSADDLVPHLTRAVLAVLNGPATPSPREG